MNCRVKSLLSSYFFVIPALTMFMIFTLYPFLKVFYLSVFEWDGIQPGMKFVWFSHFKDIIFDNSVFWSSILHAFYITFLALVFQNGLALILALAVDRGIRGGNIYRVIFYLPPVLSTDTQPAWLAQPKTALTCVAVVHMWKGFGWGFIILLAGLQNIPRELYEAAKIDGAGAWQIFRRITFPLMIPVFILVSILTILGTMQIFDIIVSLMKSGLAYHTEVPITRILFEMREGLRFGYASGMSIVFGLILLAAAMIQIRISRKMKEA